MNSFRGKRLSETTLPLGTVWLLEALAESKGRQTLYEKQSPQILKALRELAMIESAESSNRIEGVTIDASRLRPLEPDKVPEAMEELCLGYQHAMDQLKVTPLLATACLVLDFLCIHPFRDGNGRVSRLLTLLAFYHHGHGVGRYISHERIVEQTKEDYYECLQRSSTGWHEEKHDFLPWFGYLLSTLRMGYREFEERADLQRPARGSKTDVVGYALEHIGSPFGIADIARLCPNVSREMIRVVMNRWRKEGRLRVLGRGRDAKWQRLK
jgi:Fic family protein